MISTLTRRGVLAAALSALVLSATSARADDGVVRLGGSTTLVPAIANAAITFMDRYPNWSKFDAGLPNKTTVVYVTGGGSGFGVKATISDTVEIGMVSRDLKPEEEKAIGQPKTWLVGKDAVAIAATADNPLVKARKSLSSDDVRRIFSGEVKTYRDFDPSLPAQEIVLLVRDASAGSAEILQDRIMGKTPVSPHALQMPSQGALMKKLESNANAIAYISSGVAGESEKLRTFALEGVEPSNAKVVAGEYKLARPLLLISKGEPTPLAKAFVDYMLGAGQASISAQGYVPVKEATAAAK